MKELLLSGLLHIFHLCHIVSLQLQYKSSIPWVPSAPRNNRTVIGLEGQTISYR